MSATRRKGSRGGRAASRAGGPPATNALTWAESLAAGESAPAASALEWAESLAESEPAPSPWGSTGDVAPAAPEPVTTDSGSTPWGPVPAPVVVDGGDDGGGGDANPWGQVAPAEPVVARGRGKNAGKGGKPGKSRSKGKGAKSGAKGAPKVDPVPTPVGGFPLNTGPAPDAAPFVPGPDGALPDGALPDGALPDDALPDGALPDDAAPALPAPAASRKGKAEAKGPGKRPRGRLAAPDTAQQKRIRKTLRRGLPRMMDKPLVLALAGVVAVVLGLGTGWGMGMLQGEETLSSADAASCAQTQMAWTQAANAQSAMVEDQPETLRKGFINARNAMEGVTPPEDIAEEWAIAFTYYSTVANNIEKVKPNDGPAVSAAVGGAQKELDTEAMVEALKRVQAYVVSNCRG